MMRNFPSGLVERITYDAYGKARHHYRSDVDGDGDVDSAGDGAALTASMNKPIGDAAYNVDADINCANCDYYWFHLEIHIGQRLLAT